MNADHNKMTVRLFLEELDKDLAAIEKYFIPDCVVHLPGNSEPTNRDGFRQFVAMLYDAFPDLHHTVEDQIGENDKIASLVCVRGTHQGIFQGIAPAGKRVAFDDIIIMNIHEGKVIELWAQFDLLGLLGQLGFYQS